MDIRPLATGIDFTSTVQGGKEPDSERDPVIPEDLATIGAARGGTKAFSLLTIKSTLGSPGGKADPYKSIEDLISTMESLKQLNQQLGNHAKAQELGAVIAAKKKELEALKASSPPTIAQGLKDEIAAYIQNKGPMPPSLSTQHREYVDHIKSLAGNGMKFNGTDFNDIPPEEVFTRLVENPMVTFENQARYRTFQDGQIVMTTLRPQYLNPLDHFITTTKKGYVLYEKTPNGPVPVKTAQDFIKKFMDNPKDALVMAEDGTFVTSVEEAERIKAQSELDGLMAGISGTSEKPEIIVEDDFVVIGGVVLQKNK